MPCFEDKNILVSTRAIGEPGRRPILEISFKGVHDHLWPAGKKTHELIEAEVRRVGPAAR